MSEKNIVKATGAVSIGTLIVQVGGVLGQFIYAIWLTPADFGLWATASASVALVSAFLNAGEANAYLAGTSVGVAGPFKRSRNFNYLLVLVGLTIGAYFIFFADVSVAILIFLLACAIPLQGRGAMLVATFIKVRNRSRLILFQALATIGRLLVGVVVAAVWQSPIALALAYVANALILVLLGQLWLKRRAPHLLQDESAAPDSKSLRIDRAVHQFSQAVPNQIDYLTISIFANAQILGLYFFAFQATVAVSALLSSPLSKATMSELSRVNPTERVPIVSRFLILTVALVSLLVAIISLVMEPFSHLLGEQWQGVIAPLVILLSSLPSRFVIPITEALNMVNARWRRSTGINLLDAAGISTAVIIALVVLDGDVVTLSISVVFWKILFGNTRAMLSLRGNRLITFTAIVLPNTLTAVIIASSVMDHGHLTWLAFGSVMLIVAGQLVTFGALLYRSKRRAALPART